MRLFATYCFLFFISINTSAQYSLHENVGFYPTAFSLQEGEKKYNNTIGVFNSYKQGITNNLSVNVGAMFFGSENNGAILRVKYTHSLTEWAHIGISPNIYYQNEREEKHYRAGLIGILTLGKPGKFLNFAYSKGFKGKHLKSSRRDYESTTKPSNIFTVGGSTKVSKNFTLLTENVYIVEYSQLITSLSLRWEFKKNQSLQLGTYVFDVNLDGFFPIPTLSYSLHWGVESEKQYLHRQIKKSKS